MRDGLDWVFKKPERKYKNLPNADLAIKIGEIRDLVGGPFGHRKLDVRVYYVAKGNAARQSPDFRREVDETIDEYHGEFGSFEFCVWGINELVNREYELEEVSRKIVADLPILWDVNVRSFMEFQAGDIRAAICSVRGTSLARLVTEHSKAIFEENVRTFLGIRRKINKEIIETSIDPNQAPYFWFYNNGITVTCDEFDVIYGAKEPCIRLEGVQIVNGCQTSMALAHALKEGKLQPDVYILFKVFETCDPAFVDKITFTTNSQNAVSSRDLRSNDMRQRDLAKLFQQRGYYYERKPREFNNLSRSERCRMISNEKTGQAYLAVIQHKPATAMAQKSQIWSEYYDDIFGSRVEELIAAYLLYSYCLNRHKQARRQGVEGIEGAVVKYGHFHVARVIGSYQLGEDWRSCQDEQLATFAERIATDPDFLQNDYDRALEELKRIVKQLTGDDLSRVMNVFKSSRIEEELDNLSSN